MTDNEENFDNPLPRQVHETIRELHAPPSDPEYWDRLAQRIVDQLPEKPDQSAALNLPLEPNDYFPEMTITPK